MNAHSVVAMAWSSWDRHPRDPSTAARLVDETKAHASAHRIPWLQFCHLLVAMRRDGMDREHAIQQATELLEGERCCS